MKCGLHWFRLLCPISLCMGGKNDWGGQKFVNLSRLWKIYDNFRIKASDMQVDDATYSID